MTMKCCEIDLNGVDIVLCRFPADSLATLLGEGRRLMALQRRYPGRVIALATTRFPDGPLLVREDLRGRLRKACGECGNRPEPRPDQQAGAVCEVGRLLPGVA